MWTCAEVIDGIRERFMILKQGYTSGVGRGYKRCKRLAEWRCCYASCYVEFYEDVRAVLLYLYCTCTVLSSAAVRVRPTAPYAGTVLGYCSRATIESTRTQFSTSGLPGRFTDCCWDARTNRPMYRGLYGARFWKAAVRSRLHTKRKKLWGIWYKITRGSWKVISMGFTILQMNQKYIWDFCTTVSGLKHLYR